MSGVLIDEVTLDRPGIPVAHLGSADTPSEQVGHAATAGGADQASVVSVQPPHTRRRKPSDRVVPLIDVRAAGATAHSCSSSANRAPGGGSQPAARSPQPPTRPRRACSNTWRMARRCRGSSAAPPTYTSPTPSAGPIRVRAGHGRAASADRPAGAGPRPQACLRSHAAHTRSEAQPPARSR